MGKTNLKAGLKKFMLIGILPLSTVAIHIDTKSASSQEIQLQLYARGNSENQYLVGDWDGDGKDNLAVRRGNCVLMDFNFDGRHDREQCYGNG